MNGTNTSLLNPQATLSLIQMGQGHAETMKGITQNLQGNGKTIDKTAQDFEAMFLSQMIAPMFEGIKTDGMFGGGHAEEVFNDLMVQEYGKILAQSGQIGISSQIKAELLQIQEAQSHEGQN